jgi:transposase
MNELVASYPGKELHVVLDNLNTHKPKEDRWLKTHPQVHFHFIPTHSFWLNQVECWFSILSRGRYKVAVSLASEHWSRRWKPLSAAGTKTQPLSSGPNTKSTSKR